MKYLFFIAFVLLILSPATAAETLESLVEKGQKAYDAKDYNAAITCFKGALAGNPSDGSVHYNLGRAYLDKGLHDHAANHFYQAGLLFLEKGEKGSTLKAYTMLRKTHAKDLAQNLLEKLYPTIKNSRC